MTQLAQPADVKAYWCETLAPKDWYVANDDVDSVIRDRFLPTWEAAHAGELDWAKDADGSFAYLILTDQFPRNMFRGDGRSFATDPRAIETAKAAIAAGWDLETPEPERQFFYLPLMHAENLPDQDESILCFETRMPETGEKNIDHAHAHRWVIAEFGRFPYRNAALDRETTEAEQEFLDAGGYRYAVQKIQGTE